MMQDTMGTYTCFFPKKFSPSEYTLSYTYSLVFAADMYATVFKKDPLDPERGKKYRDNILRVGGSREELDNLKVNLVFQTTFAEVLLTLQ
jgi:Zn-dependent oligopeptidase